MKLCLMILSVPWYMFNGLEHTAILSHFLTFITGSSSRLLRIQFSADLTPYWFPVCHFRWKEFNPLVIWIWNQNIAICTIVGTSSHNKNKDVSHNSNHWGLWVWHGVNNPWGVLPVVGYHLWVWHGVNNPWGVYLVVGYSNAKLCS